MQQISVWVSPLGTHYPLQKNHPLFTLKRDGRTKEGRTRRKLESAMIRMDAESFQKQMRA